MIGYFEIFEIGYIENPNKVHWMAIMAVGLENYKVQ